jgi:uncharacterized repeat protein (TIGR01451 family)
MQARANLRARRAGATAGAPALRRALLSALLGVALLALAAPIAGAAPAWRIDALANSTAAPGSTLDYVVEIRNVGDADFDGSAEPISFTGTLPAGLTILNGPLGWDCSTLVVGAQTFTCQNSEFFSIPSESASGYFRRLVIQVAVDPSAAGVLTSGFQIAGGDASDGDPATPSASTVAPVTITDAPPAFGIAAFDAQVVGDAAGTPYTQAAGHPYAATTTIDFNVFRDPDPLKDELTPVEAVRDIDVDLPPGFFGDPHGVDQCTVSQLANAELALSMPLCPPSSQVGITYVRVNGTHMLLGPIPVFNMVPPVDAPARFGFNAAGTVVTLDALLRTATDYGITARLRLISEGLGIAGSTVTLWGVPSDPIHTPERACPGSVAPWEGGPTCQSGKARTAFLRQPTSCGPAGVGLPTTFRMDSWKHPGAFVERTISSHLPNGYPFAPADWGPQVGVTGCDRVPFDPRLAVTPATTAAAQPTGLAVDVSLPQTDDPDVLGQSDLRKAVVTLPAGMHLSASSAQGLQGCSPSQIALHSTTDPTCPPGSKLGTVSIKTPALPDPLEGSVYLAGPHDNPFDTLVALYLVARGSGVTIKLPGRVDLDPITGQVTTTIDNGPQAPFSDVRVELKGGSRAALANPRACGPYTTLANLTGWSGRTVALGSGVAVSRDGNGAACPAHEFSPGFQAGTESSSAGSSSPFHLRLTRQDNDEELSGLKLDMPEGLLGYISRVALCGNAQAAAGTCSDSSKIGSVEVGAGSGPDPFYVKNGRLYLTGPYKGAPYGLSVVVPAVAGPFDLGNVVVRQAIFVDKHTSKLRIVSDPLPTILQGVTLGVRDVRVAIDKPGFFLNPTSCAEKRISGEIGSVDGTKAPVSDRFQAADCASLGFKPSMALRVGGRGHTHRGQTTPFSTTLRMPSKKQANLRFVQVTLPKTINARLTVINDACTRAEFESDIAKCGHARAGSAVASTPLLRDPLKGNVYFVKNGHPIPDLFVALRGQVSFDLIGRITIPGSTRLRTTFDAAPDVPIRSFTLRLLGDSKNGSVGAAANLCSTASRRQKVDLDYIGQNGRVRQTQQALKVAGCGKPKHRRHSKR